MQFTLTTSQFILATSQVFYSYTWLEAIIVDSAKAVRGNRVFDVGPRHLGSCP